MAQSGLRALAITLDQQSPRMTRLLQQCEMHGIAAEIVKGVRGSDLPTSFIRQCFGAGYVKHALQQRPHGFLAGTLGCFLSHIKAWELIAADEAGPGRLILEDDAFPIADAPRISEVIASCDGLLYFGSRMVKPAGDPIEGRLVLKPSEAKRIGTGGDAYFCTPTVARTLLANLRNPFPTGVDGYLLSHIHCDLPSIFTVPPFRSLLNWEPQQRRDELDVFISAKQLFGYDDFGVSQIVT